MIAQEDRQDRRPFVAAMVCFGIALVASTWLLIDGLANDENVVPRLLSVLGVLALVTMILILRRRTRT